MLKRIFVGIVLCCLYVASAKSQFAVYSQSEYLQISNEENIDAIFLINGINMQTEITYTGSEQIEWRRFDQTFIANTPNFSPEEATGYIVFDKVASRPIKYIWVIDYSLYPIQINDLEVMGDCHTMSLNISASMPELVYYDKDNNRRTLSRTLSIAYTDLTYQDSVFQDENILHTLSYPVQSTVSLPAPKKDIEICLSGDNFASKMNLPLQEFCVDYKAVAVECHPKGTVEKRQGENEYKRDDSSATLISGSAPLVVAFESKANTPTASFFEWKIYKRDNPNAYQRYSTEDIHYTFRETGDYTARLEVKNDDGSCTATDSLTISVLESLLEVPNAFSPNGDGINDEFRVIFKSLKSYNITIFNRWGRVVYKSTDPSKGWDGRIGGKVAAAGTYYYVIEAVGADIHTEGKYKGKSIEYKKKGHINLFK